MRDLLQHRNAFAVAALATGLAAAAMAVASLSPAPPAADEAVGPVLESARVRGVLRVGVRAYPRPSPPGHPLPPEPDSFDADLATVLGEQLGLRVELVGLAPDVRETALRDGRVDLLVAGASTEAPARAAVMRNGPVSRWEDLRGRIACVTDGGPYAETLAGRFGASPRTFPSAVHAAYGFMAGECVALVEDGAVIDRLLGQEAWRFYTALDSTLPAAAAGHLPLATADAPSSRFIEATRRWWRASGGEAEARLRRTGGINFEVALLEDGNICH